MRWELSHRADPVAAAIADRHYNRQNIGSPQFVPPGRCVVLKCATETGQAFWVTSWPFAEYVRHEWAGAWVCSAFRNEGAGKSSDLIKSAIAATRYIFGDPPPLGMITFVDKRHVRPKRDLGHCYIIAGFRPCGETKGGLAALMMKPERMPKAEQPIGKQGSLFGEAA